MAYFDGAFSKDWRYFDPDRYVVCMYVCMYVWMDEWMGAWMYVCMNGCICTCIYLHMYLCLSLSRACALSLYYHISSKYDFSKDWL